MKREIKFRAWDSKAKIIFPVHELCYNKISNKLEAFYGVDIHDKDSDSSGDVLYGGSIKKMTGNPLAPRYELMQFTGLHDFKRTEEYPEGQEIYEGDIFPDHFNSKNFGVVKFGEYRNPWMDDKHGGHVGFYIEWENDKGLNRKDLTYWAKISVVIGNVCENPGLLLEANNYE